MTVPITVVIPVGPLPHQSRYLNDCIQSCLDYNEPSEILLINNGGTIELPTHMKLNETIRIHHEPEPLGIAGAFNKGIELAQNELAFLLGSDDLLLPGCIKKCYDAWVRTGNAVGWYFVGIVYANGYMQNTACLAAMVSKTLWRIAGGLKSDFSPYPACEIEYISRMMLAEGKFGGIYRVDDAVLYYHRINHKE